MKKILFDVVLHLDCLRIEWDNYLDIRHGNNDGLFVMPEIVGLNELLAKLNSDEDNKWTDLIKYEINELKKNPDYKSVIPSEIELADNPFTVREDGRIDINGTYIYGKPCHLDYCD